MAFLIYCWCVPYNVASPALGQGLEILLCPANHSDLRSYHRSCLALSTLKNMRWKSQISSRRATRGAFSRKLCSTRCNPPGAIFYLRTAQVPEGEIHKGERGVHNVSEASSHTEPMTSCNSPQAYLSALHKVKPIQQVLSLEKPKPWLPIKHLQFIDHSSSNRWNTNQGLVVS